MQTLTERELIMARVLKLRDILEELTGVKMNLLSRGSGDTWRRYWVAYELYLEGYKLEDISFSLGKKGSATAKAMIRNAEQALDNPRAYTKELPLWYMFRGVVLYLNRTKENIIL